MVRFILKRRVRDNISGLESETFITYDTNIPAIEKHLTSGGYGENGYERTELVGVEIIES